MIHRPTRRDLPCQQKGAAPQPRWPARSFRAEASAAAAQGSPNERVRFACIGVAGKGDSDTRDAGRHGEIVALCDIDEKHLDKMAEKFPKAKKYFDYRTMLAELGDKIDAVTVSTPDHTHAPAGAMAMRMGKHAFIQKPLTWSVEEARILRALAVEKKLCTQMGNQGTAADGFRRGVELIRSGALGTVKEIHVWTNRPTIWKQGLSRPKEAHRRFPTRSTGTSSSARPSNDRPYSPMPTIPLAWRGWLDFGTGALGDMACHTVNIAAMALGHFDPETVEVVDTFGHRRPRDLPPDLVDHQDPLRAERRPRAAARPDLVRRRRQPPQGQEVGDRRLQGEKMPASGLLLVGEKGSFFSHNDYGAEHVLLPEGFQ